MVGCAATLDYNIVLGTILPPNSNSKENKLLSHLSMLKSPRLIKINFRLSPLPSANRDLPILLSQSIQSSRVPDFQSSVFSLISGFLFYSLHFTRPPRCAPPVAPPKRAPPHQGLHDADARGIPRGGAQRPAMGRRRRRRRRREEQLGLAETPRCLGDSL